MVEQQRSKTENVIQRERHFEDKNNQRTSLFLRIFKAIKSLRLQCNARENSPSVAMPGLTDQQWGGNS